MFKRFPYLLLGAFCLCALSPLTNSTLEAAGWGRTNKKETRKKSTFWNEVYFETDTIKFIAKVPNYSGDQYSNGEVSLYGEILASDVAYAVITTLEPGFEKPKNQKAFFKSVTKANTGHTATIVTDKISEAVFVVDLTPKKENTEAVYWRFLATQDRLFKMGTNDPNNGRRKIFFESFKINPPPPKNTPSENTPPQSTPPGNS